MPVVEANLYLEPEKPKQKQLPELDLGPKPTNEKEAKRGLDELKIKQNQEMLRLLEDEHQKENDRESTLRTIADPTEKKKFEKVVLNERAKSHAKVQQLSR